MNSIEYKTTLDLFLDAVGGKWKLLIISKIQKLPKRPSELKKELPGISQRVLCQELKELIEDGIVCREVFPEVPPRVEYSLTDYGDTVIPILEKICEWGKIHLERLLSMDDRKIIVSDNFDKIGKEKKIIVKRSKRIDKSDCP